MTKVAFSLLVLLFFSFSNVNGRNVIEINSSNRKIFVEETEQYVDSLSALDYEDFQNNKDLFTKLSKNIHGTLNRDYAYWVTFDIEGDFLKEDIFYFLINDSRISHLEIWFNGKAQTLKPKGTYYPYKNRNINHRFLVNRLPQQEKVEVILKIKSSQLSLFAFEIKQEDRFLNDSYWETGLLGCAYGILIFALVFSLMMRLRFKESIYTTFAVFAVVAVLTCLYLDGSGFQFLWNDYPKLNDVLALLLPICVLACTSALVLSFLGKWNVSDPLFKRIARVSAVCLLGYFFIFKCHQYYIHNMFYLMAFIVMLFECAKRFRFGNRSTNAFLVGFFFLFFANVFYMVQPFIPIEHYHPLTRFSPHFALVVLTLTLAYSQFKKFFFISSSRDKEKQKSIMQLEELNRIKDRIHSEIAEKVALQTSELAEKNSIIYEQNAELLLAHNKLKQQTDEIVNLNLKLNQENQELKSNVQKITESRILQSTVPFKDFQVFFSSDEACFNLLEELKWQDGFKCSKCSNTKFGKGKGAKARRCTKCGTNESLTSNTIFHRIHFPIIKGFYMLFLVNKHGDNLISKDLSEIVDLRLATCWKFSKKIRAKKEEIESSGKVIESWMDLI